jgi:hypothetical protein
MSRNKAPRTRPGGGTARLLLARRASAPLLALFGLSVFGAWIASCNGDGGKKPCVPGDTQLCAGPGRCKGSQTCLADGSDYGACDCSGPLRTGPTDVTEKSITPLVGRRCQTDPDCGAGLRCFTENSNSLLGGGPAGGYCSTECTGANTCTAIDPQSDCVAQSGTASVCLRTCLNQDPTSLAENKCLTRSDVVCMSEVALMQASFAGSRQRGWCFPQCGSDEDCPGRVCDLGRGVCVNAQPVGLPLGEHCENNMACASSLCVSVSAQGVTPVEAFCSAPCVVGQPVGCGYGPSVSKRDAGCLGPRFGGFLSSEGIGDTGFCAELCDVDADCVQSTSHNWKCIVSDGARERFGRAGVCNVPPASDAGTDAGGPGTPQGQDASTADGG